MAFEFGMFHEFQRRAGQTEPRPSPTRSPRSMRPSAGASTSMWLAELHFAPERSVLSAPLILATRHRRAHQAHEDRHRRAGAAAVPSAAARRGSRHRRPDQPRPADLRRRPQRLPAHLRGLRRRLRREPRALRRDAGDPEARLDRGALLRSRASTTTTTTSGWRPSRCRQPWPRDPHRRHQPRHLSGDRRAWAMPIFVAVRLGTIEELAPEHREPTARPTQAAGHPGEGEVYLRVPVYVADTDEKAARRAAESIMHFYRTLGARLEASATQRRRARDREPRRARRRRCRPSTTRRCCATR